MDRQRTRRLRPGGSGRPPLDHGALVRLSARPLDRAPARQKVLDRAGLRRLRLAHPQVSKQDPPARPHYRPPHRRRRKPSHYSLGPGLAYSHGRRASNPRISRHQRQTSLVPIQFLIRATVFAACRAGNLLTTVHLLHLTTAVKSEEMAPFRRKEPRLYLPV